MADRPTEPIPPGGGWGQPPSRGPRPAGGRHHHQDRLTNQANCHGGDAPGEPA
jgi:hypothetical protein